MNIQSEMKFIDGALIVTATTAFLYCTSTAYNHGYFGTLKLDRDVLDQNFHQIIYQGMFLNLGTIILVPLIYAMYVTLYNQCKIDALKRYSVLRKIAKSSETRKRIFRVASNSVSWVYNLISCVYNPIAINKRTPQEKVYYSKRNKVWLIPIFAFAFILSMVYFEQQGKNLGLELINDVANGQFNKVTITHQEDSTELAYIYCGVRNCAALDTLTKEIVYFPQDGHRYLNLNSPFK